MYWLHLIILIFLTSVPLFIKGNISGSEMIKTEALESYLILIIGFLGLVLNIIQEKIAKKIYNEKVKMQGQVNGMTKELTRAYSYIGEVNRKLDIIEHISLKFPRSTNPTSKEQKELFNAIFEAIHLFGKTNTFAIRFLCCDGGNIIKEIQNNPEKMFNFPNNICNEKEENDDFLIIKSPRNIDNVFACLIMKKGKPTHTIEDIGIMRTLASQALFLFMLTYENRHLCK